MKSPRQFTSLSQVARSLSAGEGQHRDSSACRSPACRRQRSSARSRSCPSVMRGGSLPSAACAAAAAAAAARSRRRPGGPWSAQPVRHRERPLRLHWAVAGGGAPDGARNTSAPSRARRLSGMRRGGGAPARWRGRGPAAPPAGGPTAPAGHTRPLRATSGRAGAEANRAAGGVRVRPDPSRCPALVRRGRAPVIPRPRVRGPGRPGRNGPASHTRVPAIPRWIVVDSLPPPPPLGGGGGYLDGAGARRRRRRGGGWGCGGDGGAPPRPSPSHGPAVGGWVPASPDPSGGESEGPLDP